MRRRPSRSSTSRYRGSSPAGSVTRTRRALMAPLSEARWPPDRARQRTEERCARHGPTVWRASPKSEENPTRKTSLTPALRLPQSHRGCDTAFIYPPRKCVSRRIPELHAEPARARLAHRAGSLQLSQTSQKFVYFPKGSTGENVEELLLYCPIALYNPPFVLYDRY